MCVRVRARVRPACVADPEIEPLRVAWEVAVAWGRGHGAWGMGPGEEAQLRSNVRHGEEHRWVG